MTKSPFDPDTAQKLAGSKASPSFGLFIWANTKEKTPSDLIT
jgi:hypothetical protein